MSRVEESIALPRDQPNRLRHGFISLAETLLESIADVFPECDNTAMVLRVFRSVVKGSDTMQDTFIRRCHSIFKQHGDGIKDRDPEALFKIVESLEYIRELELRDKWEDPDFTVESRDHFWQYVSALKTYADLYAAVPEKVMGKIENVAGALGQQLQSGQLDLANMDLGSIGKNLLADLSPDEVAGFEGSLPEIYQSLSEVAGGLGGGMGGIDMAALMQQLTQQTVSNPNGKVDMTRVMQQLASQMPPQSGGGDMAQMMQAIGPVLQALQAQKAGVAPPALCEVPAVDVPTTAQVKRRPKPEKQRR